jgi:hypothetical protein
MNVHFRQCYIGEDFPLSHLFQRRLSSDVTSLVAPSARFIKRYGEDFDLTFNVSTKRGLDDNEIKGPTVFKKTRDVEFTIFLPFDVITRHADAPIHFMSYLLRGVCVVFDRLEIDTAKLLESQQAIVAGICSDPTMLVDPSRYQPGREPIGWILFSAFFEKRRGALEPRSASASGGIPTAGVELGASQREESCQETEGSFPTHGPPELIAIDHDEHHAEHVGLTADGRQFFLTTPFEPPSPDGTRAGSEFVALYLFDAAGELLEAKIDAFGPRATMNDEECRRVHQRRLTELGAVTPGRIVIAPFVVERFGTTFGLVPREPENEEDAWCIEAQPGNYMAFYEPWESGDYDT